MKNLMCTWLQIATFTIFFILSSLQAVVADDVCISDGAGNYIEAESFSKVSNGTKYDFVQIGDGGAYGSGALEAVNSGSGKTNGLFEYDVSGLDDKTQYALWVRGRSSDSSGSVTVGIGTNKNTKVSFSSSGYQWVQVFNNDKFKDNETITLEPNSAGSVVDAFYLTTDKNEVPKDDCNDEDTDLGPPPESGTCGDIPLYTQNITYPAIMVELDVSGSMSYSAAMTSDSSSYTYKSGNLGPIVEEIVGLPGWTGGNAITFKVTGRGPKREVYGYSSNNNSYRPSLTVVYLDGSGNEQTISSDITQNSGSGFIDSSGNLNTSQNNISLSTGTSQGLGAESATRYSGFVFKEIQVPQGSEIVDATITFRSTIYASANTSSTAKWPAQIRVQGIKKANQSTLTKDLLTTDEALTTARGSLNYTRLDVAADVLEEIYQDDSIAWGFASWSDQFGSNINRTNFHIGIKEHSVNHRDKLVEQIYKTKAYNGTPLTPAIQAGTDYFKGNRRDDEYGENYEDIRCQPKITVVITDGLGNTGTTNANLKTSTTSAASNGISVVAVGFGLSSADQLDIVAKEANERGNADDTDKVYALHEEENGVGVPFMANDADGFLEAMQNIVSSVKLQQYQGVAPAPTTSSTEGDLLVVATFNPTSWVGDVSMRKFNNKTAEIGDVEWKASDLYRENNGINEARCYIYNKETGVVEDYTSSTLDGDNYLCKELGDIINSTPKIVGGPAYQYDFDNYKKNFKYNKDVSGRDSMIYVASNDGALHAFLLEKGSNSTSNLNPGSELWRFYPHTVRERIDQDICAEDYCREYINDGSPYVGDVYDGGSWRTLLAAGIGRGGAGFYSLDITYANPLEYTGTTTATTPSELLWEFTEDQDPELGMATAVPEITRVKSGEGTAWVTIFGSGTAVNTSDQYNRNAALYAVDAITGNSIWDVNTNSQTTVATTGGAVKAVFGTKSRADQNILIPNDIPSSPLVVDVSGDSIATHIYAGNRYGDFFRLTNIGVGEEPNVSTLFSSEREDRTSPIVAKPAFVYGSGDDIWLYFGTGKYEILADKTTVDQQYMYAVRDVDASKSSSYVHSDLQDFSTGLRTVGDTVYRTISKGTAGNSNNGWVLNLYNNGSDPSERIVAEPLVVGGVVFVTTFIPGTDVCGEGGSSYLFALDYKTGESRFNEVFPGYDVDGDVGGVFIGQGVPYKPTIHGDTIFVGSSETPTLGIKIDLDDHKTALRAWKQRYE